MRVKTNVLSKRVFAEHVFEDTRVLGAARKMATTIPLVQALVNSRFFTLKPYALILKPETLTPTPKTLIPKP